MSVKINFTVDTLLNLKFDKNVKGYDAYQVDVTLDKILDDFRYYENFYNEAKQYISTLESNVKTLRDENRAKDIEIARLSKRFDGIENRSNVSNENIDLLRRIDALERALYAKGVDPSRIK